MEEIDIKDILSYFWEKKLIIIISFILIVSGGLIYDNFVKVPMYQSSTTIALTRLVNKGNVTENTDNSVAISGGDMQFNRQLISTYSSIIKSRRVIDQVIYNLKLNTTSSSLIGRIDVSNEEDTELMKISVIDSNKYDVKDITEEILKVFSKEIVEIYDIDNITVLDGAIEPTAPCNINIQKDFLMFSGIGLLLGLMIVFVIYYFDTTVKSAEQVEERLGIPILAVVPVVGNIKKRTFQDYLNIFKQKRGLKKCKKNY